MPEAALLPSLRAAVGGKAGLRSSGGEHTRWNGKATENETWSHKLPRCLKKCRQNGSLPRRQTRQLGLCSGNKSGPQLNDKSSFLRLTVTRLVDGAFPREVLYRGVSGITATLQDQQTAARSSSVSPTSHPSEQARGSFWDDSAPQPARHSPTTRPSPGPRRAGDARPISFPAQLPSKPAVPVPSYFRRPFGRISLMLAAAPGTPWSSHRHATKP